MFKGDYVNRKPTKSMTKAVVSATAIAFGVTFGLLVLDLYLNLPY